MRSIGARHGALTVLALAALATKGQAQKQNLPQGMQNLPVTFNDFTLLYFNYPAVEVTYPSETIPLAGTCAWSEPLLLLERSAPLSSLARTRHADRAGHQHRGARVRHVYFHHGGPRLQYDGADQHGAAHNSRQPDEREHRQRVAGGLCADDAIGSTGVVHWPTAA